jgi:hypothetical protein
VEKVKTLEHFLIPNHIITDQIVCPMNTTREKALCFFACFERGGQVAQKVLDRLVQIDASESWNPRVVVSQYGHADQQLDKKRLMTILNNTRYFVYPLVLPPNGGFSVHRDTYACCVAEALAMGVEVFSYPIAALAEHYADMIHWIPFPDGITAESINVSLNSPYLPRLFDDEQVERIARFVLETDKEYHSQDRIDKRFINSKKMCKPIDVQLIKKLCKTTKIL